MKKNLTFKLGLFCAALVLVSTCFITNAWAKYTKTVTATDTARVAKFVVDFKKGETSLSDTATISLFETTLNNIKKTDGKNVVEGENIVAPGSYGQFVLTVDNSSEVTVNIKITGTLKNGENTAITGDDAPIKFQVVKGTAAAVDSNYKDLSEITFEDKIDVNGTSTTSTYTVYWKWVSKDDDSTDTAFGTAENLLKMTASLSLTAEQILPTE